MDALGPYETVSKLGDGPSGAVFVARRDGQEVRLKVIEADLDARVRERILKDARVKVEHPIVLPVLDCGEDGKKLWLATPLVAGSTTLRKRLEGGPLGTDAALGLVAKLASAVAAAHEERVLHRNLKPENVILDPGGEPWLAELSLTPPLVKEMGFPEESAYLAPEQVSGTPALVDARADVWALGAILYELLAGKPAFPGPAVEAAKRILEAEPEDLAPRSPREHDALAIVALCLEKDRSERYQSAGDLAQDCRRALRGEPLLAAPLTPAARRWRRLARRPALLAGVAAGASFLVLLLVLGLAKVAFDRARLAVSWHQALEDAEHEASQSRAREAADGRAIVELSLRALAAETREAIARDEPPEAIQKRIQQLVALDGREPVLVLAGSLALRAELLDDARTWFGLAARGNPGIDGLLGLAEERERRGEDPSAPYAEVLERTKNAPESEPALVARAARDSSSAVSLLRRAVERHRAAPLLLRLARALDAAGDRRGAASALSQALELDPGEPRAHLLRARFLREEGDFVEALDAAARSLSLGPRSAPAHLERALVLAALGKLREAEKAADRAIALHDLALAHVIRAEARRDDTERALAELRRALELDPHEARALADRASVHLARGETADALVDAKSACEAAPRMPEAWAVRSRVREKLGDRSEAARDLRHALELSGERAPADLRAHLAELER